MENRTYFYISWTLFLLFLAALLFLSVQPKSPAFDTIALTALSAVKEADAYTIRVETEAEFPDKRLLIDGVYLLNHETREFLSESTTTLQARGDIETHDFSLKNMTIADDVYLMISSDDPIFTLSLPITSTWQHFSTESIPEPFTTIATPGPVTDPLLLFREGAELVLLQEPSPSDLFQGTIRYVTSIIPVHPPPKAIETLVDRLGPQGTVTLYLQETRGQLIALVFDGPQYHSTTTVQSFSTIPLVAPTGL